jgi:hypothetical protein
MPLENALNIVSEVCGAYRGTRAEHQQIEAAMGSILGTIQANQKELLAARKRIEDLEKPPTEDAPEARPEPIGMTAPE